MRKLSTTNKLRLLTVGLAVPMALWAFSSGPDPRSDGGPGGSAAACAASGCHTGTAVNAGGGNVALQFPGGMTYTPGTKQRIRVVITDSAARRYGFQLSARLSSNESRAQAGTFSTGGAGQLILCEDGTERTASGTCRTATPLEFIEHSAPSTSNTFEVEWTPPTSDLGNVRFYVAANAANGDGRNTGDRVYTANATLTFSAGGGGGNRPAITSTGGVTNGASFAAGVTTGAWTTIFGSNLSATTRDWTGAITDGNFPTTLDGVSATIDGKPAFINFISPNQVNVQTPDLAGKVGPVQVILKNAAGESMPVSATAANELPGLFLFTQAPKKHPAAVRSDGVFIGPAALFGSAVTTVPAKTGDVVLFFGTGFGPTNPAVAPGRVFSGAAALVSQVQMRIGGVAVTPAFAGLSSSGLYQFNVTIPQLANGEHRVEMSINSVSIQTDVVLTVQN